MYAKIFGSIIKSSIWDEPQPTRLLWITMLVLADEHGFVKAVERGLTRAANLSAQEVRDALHTLTEPDLESQDQDNGGRRIEKVEGGWLVLNYRKYREFRTRSQILAADRQSRKREKERQHTPDASACEDTPERDVSRASRSVTTNATASASAVLELPRAREAVDNSPAVDDASSATTVGLLERPHGHDANWCAECWGKRTTVQGQTHLRHQDWCSRRLG